MSRSHHLVASTLSLQQYLRGQQGRKQGIFPAAKRLIEPAQVSPLRQLPVAVQQVHERSLSALRFHPFRHAHQRQLRQEVVEF